MGHVTRRARKIARKLTLTTTVAALMTAGLLAAACTDQPTGPTPVQEPRRTTTTPTTTVTEPRPPLPTLATIIRDQSEKDRPEISRNDDEPEERPTRPRIDHGIRVPTDATPVPQQNFGEQPPSERPEPEPETTTGREPSEQPQIAWMYGDADQQCLPKNAEKLQDLTGETTQLSGEQMDDLQACLSSEGLMTLKISARYGETATLGELDCLQEGMTGLEGADAAVRERATTVIEASCLRNDHNPDTAGDVITSARLRAEITALFCVVDAAGGPGGYARWATASPEAINELSRATAGAGTCGMPPGVY